MADTTLYVNTGYWLGGYSEGEYPEAYVLSGYWYPGYADGDLDTSSRAYEPYGPNAQSFTEVLIDFKNTFTGTTFASVTGFRAEAFETIPQGSAVYSRTSDGKIGLAIANSTFDKANVTGFSKTSKVSGQIVDVLITGIAVKTGLNAGNEYYLSDSSAGSISLTPPSSAGHYLVRVGEAASSTTLAVQLEPPIKLD